MTTNTALLAKDYVWLSVLLAVGTVWAYAGALENGFVNLDDNVYVYENPMVRNGLSRAAAAWAFRTLDYGNWHPLTWLSLQADCQCFGLDPRGFHVTNLFLHTANTVLLFWLLRLMTGAVGRSACVAALFALHPLHVESVAWVAGRKDVLSTFFLFLCLLAWLAYVRRPAVWKHALSVVLFAFSLMAKPMGISLPVILLLLDFWPLARWPAVATGRQERVRNAISLVIEKLPFFLLSAAMTALGVFAQADAGGMHYGHSLPVVSRVLMVPVNYLTYLGQMFWPVDLAVFYPHPGATLPWWKPLAALTTLALVTALVLRPGRSRPYLPVGWLWFLIALLPAIGLVQIGAQATADRYMYLPMAGLLIVLGARRSGRQARLAPRGARPGADGLCFLLRGTDHAPDRCLA
jgi:protein O-mannosyl-transferase